MPDSNGKFRGIHIPGDAWARVFGPALADDPAYEDHEILMQAELMVGDWGTHDALRRPLIQRPDQPEESSVAWASKHGSGGEPSTLEEAAAPTPTVPSEPTPEVQPDRDCPAGHGRCCCLPGSTSEAYCRAEMI